MKAIVYERYGSPDVLSLKEIPQPVPKANEVLVKVHAASINSWDYDMLRGEPFIVRMWGLFKPKYIIPGADIAGRVEAVGNQVKKFKPGDEVFGDLCESGWGGYAEYACGKEDAFAFKPKEMTFEEAAAIPQAGLMALQSIRDKGQVKPGDKVLINGAGGGVGTFAVQIAKVLGAEVTVVDRESKLHDLRELGADHTIDYMRVDFTKNGKTYDLIIDVVSNRSLTQYRKSLNPGGRFLMIGGTMGSIFQAMVLSRIIGKQGDRDLGMLEYQANKGLDDMSMLYQSGKVIPVIDHIYPLAKTADAFRYYADGNFRGKVVINIES
ncbi:MAG TPA: NAD(P)-dependent alcohol dehydrogenase [Ohtaekwangia sp.]|nr:NAD(P)-dependent alcohol dehydrogenase [Ohtaekwangia sp.]